MLSRETALSPLRYFSKGRGIAIALKAAVTLGCFWYVFRQIDVAELRRSLPEFDFRWATFATVLLMLQIPLVALRWWQILAVLKVHGDRLTYIFTLFATAKSQFVSQIVPTAVGDGVRVWLLARSGSNWRDAAMSVVIDRGVGVGLLFAFAFCILLLPSRFDVLGGYHDEILIAFGAILFIGVIGLEIGARLGQALAWRGHGRWLANLFVGARSVVFGPRSIIILGIGCLVHVLTIAAIWSLGRAQGLALAPVDAAVLFTVMIGVAIVPISVGGWGLREFAMVSLFGNYGLAPERALMFSMYFGLAWLIASLPGAVGWLTFTVRGADHSSGLGR